MSDPTVIVRLTAIEARQTAAWLQASTTAMGADLRSVWERTPVGTATAKITAAVDGQEQAA
jgi:hypothetical protein